MRFRALVLSLLALVGVSGVVGCAYDRDDERYRLEGRPEDPGYRDYQGDDHSRDQGNYDRRFDDWHHQDRY